jgi:hypothetical protein
MPELPPHLRRAYDLTELAKRLETDWRLAADGVLMGSKRVPAQGLGAFGLISLSAFVTPTGGRYSCHVQAACLPLGCEETEEVATVEEAKSYAETTWAGFVSVIALTFESRRQA